MITQSERRLLQWLTEEIASWSEEAKESQDSPNSYGVAMTQATVTD